MAQQSVLRRKPSGRLLVDIDHFLLKTCIIFVHIITTVQLLHVFHVFECIYVCVSANYSTSVLFHYNTTSTSNTPPFIHQQFWQGTEPSNDSDVSLKAVAVCSFRYASSRRPKNTNRQLSRHWLPETKNSQQTLCTFVRAYKLLVHVYILACYVHLQVFIVDVSWDNDERYEVFRRYSQFFSLHVSVH